MKHMLLVMLTMFSACKTEAPPQGQTSPEPPVKLAKTSATATQDAEDRPPVDGPDAAPTTVDAGTVAALRPGQIPPPIPALTEVSSIPKNTRIFIEQAGFCRRCTTQWAAIDAHGKVTLHTTRAATDTREPAERESEISKKQLRNLLRKFGEIGFLDIDPAHFDRLCTVRKHGSQTKLTLAFDGRTQTVRMGSTCHMDGELPEALRALNKEIRETVKMEEFLKRASRDKIPKQPVSDLPEP